MMDHRARFYVIVILLACSIAPCLQGENGPSQRGDRIPARLARFVEANVIATHAYQVNLAKKNGKGDRDCYSANGLSESELEKVVAHQASLLKEDLVQVLSWTRQQPSIFDPSKDLDPILAAPLKLSPRLPVNVFSRYLSDATKADGVTIRAIACLYQCCLEMERDGTLLWDLMAYFIALGLPTYVGQIGLPGTDADFLKVGNKLAPLTCDSPFEDNPTSPFAWQICGRKIWNWGLKNLHLLDQFAMARELLDEPDIRILLPRIKTLPLQRIAVVGHSFTMQSHWSTPGSFAAVVGAALGMTNPSVQYRQWASGGLTASRANKMFYQDVLAWKPDLVLFAVAMRTDQDLADMKTMCHGFSSAGSKVCAFDSLRDPSEDAIRNQMGGDAAKETGLTIIEVGQLLATAPDKAEFLCLDKIHMTEPYHRLMAREWLKFLVGARAARLAVRGTGESGTAGIPGVGPAGTNTSTRTGSTSLREGSMEIVKLPKVRRPIEDGDWNMAYLFPDEIAKARDRSGLVILPLGPIEWHGPHLTMGCDNLLAHDFARRLGRELQCPYHPPLFVSTERERNPDMLESLGFGRDAFIEGMDFPKLSMASAYFREETFALVVRDALNILLSRMRFRHVLIVNGHGANNQKAVLNRLCAEFNSGQDEKRVMWVYPAFPRSLIAGAIGHAASHETSMLAAAWPGNVDLGRLPADGKLKNADYAIVDGETFDLAPTQDHTLREEQDPRTRTDPAWGKAQIEKAVQEVIEQVRTEWFKSNRK
jgi:creatinine amidohydrolase